jgi:hypothetical protein
MTVLENIVPTLSNLSLMYGGSSTPASINLVMPSTLDLNLRDGSFVNVTVDHVAVTSSLAVNGRDVTLVTRGP